MLKRKFEMEYWQDGGWFCGRLIGIPGVFSQGKTLDELEENIKEAYQLIMEDEEARTKGAKVKAVEIVV